MCCYHKKYGDQAYKCGGASCPFAASSCGRSPSKNMKPHLHNLSSALACADFLVFVADKHSKVPFLVDIGASRSLFPLNYIDDRNIQLSTLTSLKVLGSGVIDVLGIYKTQINFDFSRLFKLKFCVSDMPYVILGADFLACHKLIIDISAQKLTESIEIEQCSGYIDSEFNICCSK